MAFFSGRPDVTLQLPQYAQPQASAMNTLTQRGLENANFQGIENLARKNFAEKGLPLIASRFNSMGIGGFGSSGHMQEAGGAAANLEAQLGALRGQHGLQELQLGLKPQFENIFQPGTESGLAKSATAASGPLLEYGGKMGLDWIAKNYGPEAAKKAAEETAKSGASQLGGQGTAAAANAAGETARDVGGGTLAGLAAKASGYAIPAAVGLGVGAGAGYLANKAGASDEASWGIGAGAGTATGIAAAKFAAGTLVGASFGPIALAALGAGLTTYGLKKLYNWWYSSNEGDPQRDSLENRMPMMKYGVGAQ